MFRRTLDLFGKLHGLIHCMVRLLLLVRSIGPRRSGRKQVGTLPLRFWTCFRFPKSLLFSTVGDGSSVAQSHWVRKGSFVDSRGSVTDVQFAPRHLGLLLVRQENSIKRIC